MSTDTSGPENGARAYLSIGEVLDALREEFADITISKIRFLESQGLLEPERTPSGYRKFYPADLARLRWVLQQQREKYLPLKVIRAGLVDAESAGLLPVSSGAGGAGVSGGSGVSGVGPRGRTGSPSSTGIDPRQPDHCDPADELADGMDGAEGTHLDAPPRALGEGRHPSMQSLTVPARRNAPVPSGGRPAGPVATVPAPVPADPERAQERPAADALGSRNPLVGIGTGVSLTLNELASASGLGIEDIRLLEQFGLIIGRHVFAATYYDEDALVAAKATAAFRAFGVEPRHLRMYKTAADREADFFSQIVTPLLRRRRDDARVQAAETLETLARLGEQLRVVALRQVLRAALDVR